MHSRSRAMMEMGPEIVRRQGPLHASHRMRDVSTRLTPTTTPSISDFSRPAPTLPQQTPDRVVFIFCALVILPLLPQIDLYHIAVGTL